MIQDLSALLEKQGYDLYPKSVRATKDGGHIFVVRKGADKFVGVICGEDLNLDSPVSSASLSGASIGLYTLTWENYEKLKGVLPIAPSPCDKYASFGTGDRLGLVTAAHLSVDSNYPVFPVVSQQSPRELERTGRTFKSVLLDAVMGVLESGYEGKYGADADHIKDEKYLRLGAEAGYTMYTLDVSEWLADVKGLSADEIKDKASKLSPASLKILAELSGTKIPVPGMADYEVSGYALMESALIYEKSMDQVKQFRGVIKEYMSDFDLEVSIDEGSRDTTPEDHIYVASYLKANGVDFTSLAPKFPGEFQKGVDYMGDVKALEASFRIHAALADGYRLSLHSGSDKFSIYPLFGEITGKNFHIKTSGTSWLQAVKLIASANMPLFEELYKLCLDNLAESKKAYHVYITHDLFPAELPADVMPFFDTRDVRQLFHISYGVLLDHKGAEIFSALKENESEHYAFVGDHINEHLKLVF